MGNKSCLYYINVFVSALSNSQAEVGNKSCLYNKCLSFKEGWEVEVISVELIFGILFHLIPQNLFPFGLNKMWWVGVGWVEK